MAAHVHDFDIILWKYEYNICYNKVHMGTNPNPKTLALDSNQYYMYLMVKHCV